MNWSQGIEHFFNMGLVARVLGYRSGGPGSIPGTTRTKKVVGLERGALSLVSKILFLNFPIYLHSVYIHINTIGKLCVWKRGRVEECSVAPLRDKMIKTLCGCREKRVQTKENTN
jgi:hypothetical protein